MWFNISLLEIQIKSNIKEAELENIIYSEYYPIEFIENLKCILTASQIFICN